MPVRAAWHTGLEDALEQPERVEDVGVPITLSADGRQAELRSKLIASVEREIRLADTGVSCKIKSTDGTSCWACPLHDAGDELCRLGREQERLVTELRVEHLGGRRQ